ncbi:MAG TPA: hypothetical protein VNP98_02725 [Chthoniobacterales bacterium]|nr:hypothetical protein [Chthoniobacterales bacterium]
MAATLLPLLLLTAQLPAQSALDGFDPNVTGPNSKVAVTVVQPDGKILIGGIFSTVLGVPRQNIARLNPDGTLDAAFDPNANDNVYSIALQADGKILVAGDFETIGGQSRNHIARLDPSTGLADSFDPNASAGVHSIAVQADGKILAGGVFFGTNSIGGQTRNRIARLDPATGLADSFDPNANNNVYSIALQTDGKILVAGMFDGIGVRTRNYIARLDPTTGLADSFNPNPNNSVESIAFQADGKVLVGGSFISIGGQARNYIARLDRTTGLADSFNPHADANVLSIALQADGKILVGGAFSSIGGQPRTRIARLDPTTGLADSFDQNADNLVWSLAVQADGKILVGGWFTTIGGQTRNRIARLETDGRLDQTLNSNIGGLGGSGFILATAVQPDGKILIGGRFATVLGVARNNIARLNTDGTLDASFDPNANADVHTIAVQADGKILVGGNFFVFNGKNSIGGQPRNRIARLDATTGLADSFDPDAGAVVLSIAVQADGKILAGGAFQGLGGQLRRFIARLDPTTGLADSFDPDPNDTVLSIVVQPDGKILAGGAFASIGGETRNSIARLDATTGAADGFNPNANGSVYSIAVQADGKVLAGGQFASIGGQTRNSIARLDPTTGLADSFNPNADTNVYSIALQADGEILAGGNFTSIGGQTRNYIARLDPGTGLADSFNPNANDQVFSITIQADGKILAGGAFSGANSIGGEARNFLARLSNDTAALQDLALTQTTITWTRGGSSPQFAHVSFEFSTDNVSYVPLGNGTLAGNNWTLTGLNLPTDQNIYIRARGHYGSGMGNNSGSITESVRNAFFARPPATLGNISTRLRVQTGDNAMIGGFIITGTEPKTVIVRGIGPSLPVPGALADPVIEIYGSFGQLLGTNDNWNDSLTRQEIIDSGLAPSNDLESALWGTINPGAYTVVVRGVNNTTGIAMFEVYDLDQTADSKLANISTRGFVETGDNVLIAGVIVTGENPLRAIVRALGPSLPVAEALEDPILELYDGNGGLIAVNYNWRDDQEAEILGTGIPPSNDLEAAIVRDFAPGNYTAIVRGLNNTTGMALVEVYGLN